MKNVAVVCILGMHRSGTSCLAGCLQDCGLHLGEVVTHTWDNVKGNRESLPIRAINDEVLKFSGGSWGMPPEHLKWNDAHRRCRDEIIAERSAFKIWGFKDPRALLTLSFWLEALPDMQLVGTFRHHLAVTSSLSQRDRIPESQVLKLWSSYNQKLVKYGSEYDIPLVCFDWPADRYIQAVLRISKSIGLNECAACETVSFFDKRLRKHHELQLPHTLAGEAEAIYHELLSRCLAPEANARQDVSDASFGESDMPDQR